MSSDRKPLPDRCEVAIVGAGPSGISAAIELAKLGVREVLVLERESEAGGIPRHCGHPPFGLREFHRVLSGPRYARKLVAEADAHDVSIHLDTTIVSLRAGGSMLVSTAAGAHELSARCVLLATGVRETPRSARLMSGQRPAGIMNTGTLQSTIYLAGRRPFKRPLIVGSELVSFSALLTCRHAGIKPVAMVEAGSRPTAWKASTVLPRLLGIPLRLNTRVHRILGHRHVEGVEIADIEGGITQLACDGVVFTGRFIPESSLARLSHLKVDPLSGGPAVDQYGRCSDPAYFVTGNLLRPVETAGWCWNEGRRTGRNIHASLCGQLPAAGRRRHLSPGHGIIKYIVPQNIVAEEGHHDKRGSWRLQLRVTERARGQLSFTSRGRELYRARLDALPERRVLVDLPSTIVEAADDAIVVDFIPS